MPAPSSTPSLRHLQATRFIQPLKEGGSVPGLFEASDDGLYVVKLHGAAQGPKSLTAELIAGEIARALGLNVPELVLIDLDKMLTVAEPDPEIQDHLQRSVGLNLGLDFLPGALPYDPATAMFMDPVLAADIVWLDAFIANVDRTTRNPNMLLWGDEVWLIDQGASIYPHHRWTNPAEQGRRSFPAIKDHVLLTQAGSLVGADVRLAPKLDDTVLWSIIGSVPDEWLPENEMGDAGAQRQAYLEFFLARLEAPRPFIEEAERCRLAQNAGAIDPDRENRGRRRE
ncbi:MAG: hypothetical protein KC435_10920 [Thermomicrobiales bacterium]|nr:hypothetical protein [Thermomicrobiales bacterium]